MYFTISDNYNIWAIQFLQSTIIESNHTIYTIVLTKKSPKSRLFVNISTYMSKFLKILTLLLEKYLKYYEKCGKLFMELNNCRGDVSMAFSNGKVAG